MFKLFAKLLIAGMLLGTIVTRVHAGKPVNVYFFWGEGCPHCASAKPFLQRLDESPEIKLHEFEVWKNSQNRKFLVQIGTALGIDISGVPITIIGNTAFVGFSEKITSEQIENRIEFCLNNDCPDSVAEIVGENEKTAPIKKDYTTPENALSDHLNIPILGNVQVQDLSLPLLTIVLGALDGFNPCAMWTLLFLISLLLGMKDKKRRWILGSTFIFTSSFVYFLFMAAWLNLILFLGFIVWLRVLIGIVALVGGGYNLKEFLTNKASGCKVVGSEKRRAVFEKLKTITHERRFLFALIGIILLAFAVNLVELICSAGLPIIFTQVLAMSNLPIWKYYLYMLLYIFVFMLDDLFVFFTAMFTLEMTGISTKYSHLSHLIGGILMVIIGALLIFKSEWLMF